MTLEHSLHLMKHDGVHQALHTLPSDYSTVANIFDRQGTQGFYDGASKADLENEFGTSNDDDVIKQILEKGTIQRSEVRHCLLQLSLST